MKIYKIFTNSALLMCSVFGAAYAQNYWCSSDGFGYLATMTTPEISCAAAKGSPSSYASCVENVRKNNENANADIKKGICKKIQEQQAIYGQTKCKYFYIIENGKIEEKGHESISLSKNSDLEKEKCLQKAKEEVSKTIPSTSSTKSPDTSVKWADQNLSTQTKPRPVSLTPAVKYNNPSDAYKK